LYYCFSAGIRSYVLSNAVHTHPSFERRGVVRAHVVKGRYCIPVCRSLRPVVIGVCSTNVSKEHILPCQPLCYTPLFSSGSLYMGPDCWLLCAVSYLSMAARVDREDGKSVLPDASPGALSTSADRAQRPLRNTCALCHAPFIETAAMTGRYVAMYGSDLLIGDVQESSRISACAC